jgi:hypothetical protein
MTDVVKELKVGDIVMINPSYERACFRGCLLTVTEVKDFGCQGFVQGVGKTFEEDGGQYYLRPTWDDFEITGGVAPWMIKEEDE